MPIPVPWKQILALSHQHPYGKDCADLPGGIRIFMVADYFLCIVVYYGVFMWFVEE